MCRQGKEGSSPKALAMGAGAGGAGSEPERLGRKPCPVASLPTEASRLTRLRLLAREFDCTRALTDIRHVLTNRACFRQGSAQAFFKPDTRPSSRGMRFYSLKTYCGAEDLQANAAGGARCRDQ